MRPDDPARGITKLMMEHKPPDENAPGEAAQTPTDQPDEEANKAAG